MCKKWITGERILEENIMEWKMEWEMDGKRSAPVPFSFFAVKIHDRKYLFFFKNIQPKTLVFICYTYIINAPFNRK